MRSEIVPRQRHWMESSVTPVPLTRHQTMASLYQGCSQKALAPPGYRLVAANAARSRRRANHMFAWSGVPIFLAQTKVSVPPRPCQVPPPGDQQNELQCGTDTLVCVSFSITPYTPSPLRRNTADCSTDLRHKTTAPPTAGRRFRLPAHREPTPARGIQAPWRARRPHRDPSP